MADINQIVNADSYRGSPDAGGAGAPAIKLDTEPLFQLAHYTQLYNKDVWDKTNADQDFKIAQLAKASDINLNNLVGKDKEEVGKNLDDLKAFAIQYAKNPNVTLKEQLEWQSKLGETTNKYNAGKIRAVGYHARLNNIDASTADAADKDLSVKDLEKEFNSTDISTPISAGLNYKLENFGLPTAVAQKFNSVAILDNNNLSMEGSIYNPKINAALADATILGIKNAYPQKGSDAYNKLSDREKSQADHQALIPSEGQGWTKAKEPLNVALMNYVKDGKFDSKAFEDDNASNTVLMNAYNGLKKYDKNNRDRYAQAQSGYFDDKGLKIAVPPNVVADDFKVGFVDFAKGVTENQLVQSGMYAKTTDTFEKKLTPTDNAIQLRGQDITARGQTLNHEEAMARIAQDKTELDAKKEQWKASQTGGETVKNGALLRAQRIFTDLKSLADKNGVISPDKLRQLNAEQLKYLGTEQVITGDNGIPHSVYKPLDLTGDAEFAIQVTNDGQIRVLTPKNGNKLERLDNGGFSGHWDNSRSTNVLNVGTNILNEELSKAGSKELNSYLSIDAGDLNNGVTTNQIGGGTSQSGSVTHTVDAQGNINTHTNDVKPKSGGMTDEQYKAFLKKNGLQ